MPYIRKKSGPITFHIRNTGLYSIHFIGATLRDRLNFFTLQSGQPCEKPPTHLARGQRRIEPGTSRVLSQHPNHYTVGAVILFSNG